MRRIKLLSVICLMLASVPAFANTVAENVRPVLGKEIAPKDTTKQKRLRNHLIAPKGEWQCGLSVMYADFSTSDTEFMLLLQGVNASASMLRLAPEAAYTFADNHAVGLRIQYTNLSGGLDTATADLLGNLTMSIGDVNALSQSFTASVFQRTYVGLDNKGRVGIFWDYILGVTRTKTQMVTGDPSQTYSLKKKVHLGFAPGVVYFPMNNVSVQASISLADVSYGNITAYEEGQISGQRNTVKASAGIDLLGLNFGLTVHF